MPGPGWHVPGEGTGCTERAPISAPLQSSGTTPRKSAAGLRTPCPILDDGAVVPCEGPLSARESLVTEHGQSPFPDESDAGTAPWETALDAWGSCGPSLLLPSPDAGLAGVCHRPAPHSRPLSAQQRGSVVPTKADALTGP